MAFLVPRRTIVLATAATALAGRRSWAAGKGIGTYPVAVPAYAQMFVAVEQGYVKDEGFEFKLIQGGSGVKSREIMASGEADFAIEDIVHCLQLNNRGRPARAVNSADTRSPGQYFIIRKDLYDQGIDTVAKFAAWKRPEGKKPIFGVSSLGGTAHLWAHFFMEQFGFADNVTWVGVGNVDTMLGSLKTKQIDILNAAPSIMSDAERNGWGKTIYRGSDANEWNKIVGGNVPVNANICLLSTMQKEPEKIQAYTTACYRAVQFMKTHTAEQIFDVIEPYVGSTSRDANILELQSVKEVTDFNGIIDPASYERGGKCWYRDITGIKPMPLADIFDDRFVKAAQAKYPNG
jgi:NitT/TauT family transport system substrate-binding protein